MNTFNSLLYAQHLSAQNSKKTRKKKEKKHSLQLFETQATL